MNHNGKSRDELAREANQVRTKLMRTVEQLDRRRHDAMELRLQLKRHVRQLAWIGGVLLLATAGAVALVVHRISNAAPRRMRNRWRLAKGVWKHPERAMRAEKRSLLRDVARSVLVALASAIVMVPARRAVSSLLLSPGGRRESGEPPKSEPPGPSEPREP